jgi:hypothetical protein
LQRARFLLAREENRLVLGDFSEGQLASLRGFLERNPGRSTSYEAISQLALALNGLGRKQESLDILRRQLLELPGEQRRVADEWHLLLGLIAGANDAVGRNSLMQILEKSNDREKQRVALLLLARVGPSVALKNELNRLIDRPECASYFRRPTCSAGRVSFGGEVVW